jgi:subtilisin family serine protease
VLALVCIVALLAICSACLGQGYVPGEVLVKFRPGTPGAAIAAAHAAAGAHAIQTFETIGIRHMRLDPDVDVPAAVEAYEQNPNVLYAEPNYILTADATVPNDPGFPNLWGLNNAGQTGGTADADIDAPEAWDLTTSAGSRIVAVIDTGVDYTHPDLAANVWTNPGEIPGNGIDDDGNGYIDDIYGYDFCNHDSDPMDDNSHGSHCAGTIGGVGNNGVGVAGVNWTVKIMALKFLNAGGGGSTADAISCVQYATMMKARGCPIAALSNSWGGGGYSQALYDAIAAAGNADIVFVASAGNSAVNTDTSPQYPAGYNLANIISVAASDHNDALASFSNWGPQSVDLAAPGVNVYSSIPGNSYGYKSGTSMACPHVSGAVALLKAYTGKTAPQIKGQLLSTVDPKAAFIGKMVSGGRLNLYNALTETFPNRPPVAANDSYSTDKGTVLTVGPPGVLANDSDPDGDPITAVLGTGPANGTLTYLNADGSFQYTPKTGFSGTDTFTYTASDGQFTGNVATVTITVVWPTGAITGTVSDAQGKAVNQATVKATGQSGYTASTKTDKQGRYTLSGLPTQSYTVVASKARQQGSGQVVVVARQTVTLNIAIR